MFFFSCWANWVASGANSGRKCSQNVLKKNTTKLSRGFLKEGRSNRHAYVTVSSNVAIWHNCYAWFFRGVCRIQFISIYLTVHPFRNISFYTFLYLYFIYWPIVYPSLCLYVRIHWRGKGPDCDLRISEKFGSRGEKKERHREQAGVFCEKKKREVPRPKSLNIYICKCRLCHGLLNTPDLSICDQ